MALPRAIGAPLHSGRWSGLTVPEVAPPDRRRHHDAEARRQNFGMVRDAFVRLVNADSDQEVLRFDLSEDYSTETAMVFGEIYRRGGEWKFRAVGQGYAGGLYSLCMQHGVNVA